MTIRNFSLEVDNPDFWMDPPILEISGTWADCVLYAANHLIAGEYPAKRYVHTETDELVFQGKLTISDDPGRTVTWTESVQTDC